MCISLPASIKEACIQSITVPWRWTYPDGFNNVWWLEIWTGQFSNNNYVIVQKVRSPWLMVSMLDGHHHVVGIFEPLHRIIGSGRPSHTVNSWEGEGRRGKGEGGWKKHRWKNQKFHKKSATLCHIQTHYYVEGVLWAWTNIQILLTASRIPASPCC